MTDFHHDFHNYLDALEFAPIKSLQELIDFNIEHAGVELAPGAHSSSSQRYLFYYG